MKKIGRTIVVSIRGLIPVGVLGLLLVMHRGARADNIYVTNYSNNTIGEYTTAGATVNASLITGLDGPVGIAASGSDLFVANPGNNTVGEYTTAGATVNASLIPGLNGPYFLAVTPTATPEPSALVMMGFGSAALLAAHRRRRRES